ncbi:DNA-methyltransferase, partial [Candidatus Omnitrophota bacterium]
FMRDRQTNLKRMRENFFGDAGWDDLQYEEWVKHMDGFFKKANQVLKIRGSLIMFMSLMKAETVIKLASKHKFYYKTTGIWHKRNPMPRNMNLHFINSVEGWIYFINEGKTGTFRNKQKAIHDFVESSVTSAGERRNGKHPTQKPETVIEFFIDILSKKGDTIMDPFMGSGTSGIVAKRMDRDFIGIELNKKYFKNASERIYEKYTKESNSSKKSQELKLVVAK